VIRSLFIGLLVLSRYCDNCVDWLCQQCKHAHARVRLTKDHIVSHKTTNETRESSGQTHIDTLLCQVNTSEHSLVINAFIDRTSIIN
jgi:hypothetical protein